MKLSTACAVQSGYWVGAIQLIIVGLLWLWSSNFLVGMAAAVATGIVAANLIVKIIENAEAEQDQDRQVL